MKQKVNKSKFPQLDKFDRKQKRQGNSKSRGSKRKLSIYDEFEEDGLPEYPSSGDDSDN